MSAMVVDNERSKTKSLTGGGNNLEGREGGVDRGHCYIGLLPTY